VAGDLLERADLLGGDAQFDLCSREDLSVAEGGLAAPITGPVQPRYRHGDIRRHVVNVQHPRGPMPVLKMLQTNACARDCYYCPFRAGRGFRREAFAPDELAGLVDQLYRARVVRGLFLSSGVVGHDDYSMEQIVGTAETLRHRYQFRGYLHLKLMPGASDAAIEAALRLADRVSINLEAPNADRLARLSGTKDLNRDLLTPLRRVRAMIADGERWVSRTTQFVVGAAGESDLEILTTTTRLYRELGLARVYYSAFRPTPDTPLDGLPAESPTRQRRLYQADALVRDYRFSLADLGLDGAGRLRLDIDPKLAWAQAHGEAFPVEVNRATRSELLRVPGFGVKAVEAILTTRRQAQLRDPLDLRRLGIATGRALPWVTIDGHAVARQLPLPPPPA
jgi:predicted DNA-binding helix-hairpin-helix protein